MNQIKKSIRAKVLCLLIASISAFSIMFALSLYGKNQIIGNYQKLLNEDMLLLQQINSLNLDFKTQVQEWKNTLLRGHDLTQREKYWVRFESYAQEIPQTIDDMLGSSNDRELITLLQSFEQRYPFMLEKYQAGYQTFLNSNFDHIQADQAVRGIDREPSKLLIAAAALVKSRVDARGEELLATSQTNSIITAILSASGILVILILTSVAIERMLIRPIKMLSEASQSLAQGDFTTSIASSKEDELGQLIDNVESIRTDLGDLVAQIKNQTVQLNDYLTLSNEQQQQITGHISDSLDHASDLQMYVTTIIAQSSELTRSGKSKSDIINDKADAMKNNINAFMADKELITEVNQAMQGSIGKMQALKTESAAIANMLATIQNIAEQTNLLALNAAIEAARAGDSGRGFAVVADEVRQLAMKTQVSAAEINATINRLNDNTEAAYSSIDESISLTTKTTDRFAEMIEFMQSSNELLTEVVEQQVDVTDQIDQQFQSSKQVEKDIQWSVAATDKTKKSNNEVALITQKALSIINQMKALSERFVIA